MKLKLATYALAAVMAAGPAMADLVFPSLSYRTGPYAAGGIPFADGYADYFTMINERDGGVGGVPIKVIECETGYSTEKGVECYESTKGQGALLYQPLSTGITYNIIPKTGVDNIPVHSMGYGRTSAANGKVFEWVFNYPTNYWNGASVAVKHILDQEGGDLNGKTIALLFLNGAYGKEPIPTLNVLAEKHGFDLTLLPVEGATMQDQKSQWLQIRREKPDYVLMWGWGAMNPAAIQEAANIRYPMDHFIGVWWSASENDVLPAGDGANGYKALAIHAPGNNFPLYDDLKANVYDKGMTAGAGDQSGTVLYNRGLYAAMLAVEAVKTAQGIHGVGQIDAAMMRDGMEALEMSSDKMAALGLPGFGPEFSVSCENHGGNGLAAVQQWDAASKTWSLVTDYISPDSDVVNALIAADSAAFAAENNISERCN